MTRRDEAPDQRLLFDDPRVRLDVRDGGDRIGELEDVVVTADGGELAPRHQALADRDRVDRRPLGEELGHRLEDLRVRLAVVVFLPDDLEDDVQGLVFEEDAADDGPLGLQGARGSTPAGTALGRGRRPLESSAQVFHSHLQMEGPDCRQGSLRASG